MMIIGVDIGGTQTRAVIAHKTGIADSVEEMTVKTGSSKALPRQVMSMIDILLKRNGIEKDGIERVGVSAPGPFGLNNGRKVLTTPNICGGLNAESGPDNDWVEIPIEEELNRHFDIVMENDAISSALVHKRLINNIPDDFIYITWSTGIGGGIVTGGSPVRGSRGNASHIGHMIVMKGGPLCNCGNRGDMESIASGSAIERAAGMEASRVFESYDRSDESRSIINNAAEGFTAGLVSLSAIFDTELFIIGGSVFTSNSRMLTDIIERTLGDYSRLFTRHIRIAQTPFDDLALLSGLINVMPEDWYSSWSKNMDFNT
ncbi:MAG: ROK family protein [bacterium]